MSILGRVLIGPWEAVLFEDLCGASENVLLIIDLKEDKQLPLNVSSPFLNHKLTPGFVKHLSLP